MVFLRFAGAGIAGILLTSCSGETTGTPAPERSVSTSAVATAATDEQQITQLLEQEAAAMNDWDLDRLAELTCQQYREDTRAILGLMTDFAMLPVSEFLEFEQSPAQAPAIDTAFREVFPTASDASIDQAVDAVIGADDAAVAEAVDQLFAETTTANLDSIENITVTGDTATADVTMTVEMFGEPPETQTERIPMVREDGVWKDCDDPNS